MTTTDKLTAETITVRQIRDLRADAEEHDDYLQIDWCDLALAAHETSGSDGHHLQSPGGDRAVTRTEARQVCADVINAARSQEDATEECAYCGESAPANDVPARSDDDTWSRIAAHHRPDCEWISTRAHTVSGP